MWESINNSQQSKHNLLWLMEGMKFNTLTWVMDGSYNRKRAADLCGVGWVIFCNKTGTCLTGTFWERSLAASSYRWIIFCSKTGTRLTGIFWERSPSVSSYRAEMLGLCALYLFARALSEFYTIQVPIVIGHKGLTIDATRMNLYNLIFRMLCASLGGSLCDTSKMDVR